MVHQYVVDLSELLIVRAVNPHSDQLRCAPLRFFLHRHELDASRRAGVGRGRLIGLHLGRLSHGNRRIVSPNALDPASAVLNNVA